MPQTILITGAGSGIGKATALQFLKSGWSVGLIGRREKPLEDIASVHKTALALPCDVTDEQAIEQAFSRAVEKFGNIDVLFNNAGIYTPGATIDEIPIDDWKRSVEVNLTGSFICAKQAFKVMRAQQPQGGRIINNGSVSAQSPRPHSTSYTATKHAITGLTKSISLDGRPYDIACGQIDIGNARTEMVEAMARRNAEAGKETEATMDVDDVARAVLHMAQLPLEANVQFMTIMATKMQLIGRG
ncbi:MAG: SDR family oxidoreductase [Hyphomicrobiales bacterium]|nr:SDR family oxidoreductase [Hyphomicrobiales bacterium]